MNFAAVFLSSPSVHISNQRDVPSDNNNSFASLFEGITTSDNVSEDTSEQLKQLLNSIKKLLELEGGKKLEPDNKRHILPITLMQNPISTMGELEKFLDEQYSHIIEQLEAAISMLSQSEVAEELVMIMDQLEQILNDHKGEETAFTDEQLSHMLEQLEVALAFVHQHDISDDNELHALEDYFQDMSDHLSMNQSLSRLMEQLENGDISEEQLVQVVQALKDILSNIPEEMKLSNEQMVKVSSVIHAIEQQLKGNNPINMFAQISQRFDSGSFTNQEGNVPSGLYATSKAIQEVSTQAHELIEEVLNQEQSVKIHKQLAQLLEQALHLKQQLTSLGDEELAEGEKDTVDKIWSNLQSMYEKRTSINKGGIYTENAKVRPADVGTWLQHMVADTELAQTQSHISMHQQMTPVEQYVMHIRTQDGGALQNEQMMQQFQQIVNQSALGKNQFLKQLSITIQPEQLGEMTIRLVQIEGEMIAKITVTSQATKSALESNLHQLKNMFAPHQVMIEKQEGDSQANFEQDNTKEDQQQSSHQNEEDHHGDDKEQGSFQEKFEQILEETVGEH